MPHKHLHYVCTTHPLITYHWRQGGDRGHLPLAGLSWVGWYTDLMNEEFALHAQSRGEVGVRWLDSIPRILDEYAAKWSLQVGPSYQLTWNYVAPCTCSNGEQAVIKIGFPGDREFQTEIEALALCQGDGIVKLLQADRENAVILIECAAPGTPLSTLEDDEEAARILARVMKKLWKPLPAHHRFIPIAEWTTSLRHFQKGSLIIPETFPVYLVEKATALFDELIATSTEAMLLHGDLHHDNVLLSDIHGWLAIDPKGIAAEPAYETAAMLRNPRGRLLNNPDRKNILTRRVQVLAEELQMNPQRIIRWGIAQSVLSAVWSLEDEGQGWEEAIEVARVLEGLVCSG